MNINDFSLKECTKLCTMIGCSYNCKLKEMNVSRKLKILYRCNDKLCSKVYTDINKYNRHTKEHTKYLSKISQTLQQEDKKREKYKINFSN